MLGDGRFTCVSRWLNKPLRTTTGLCMVVVLAATGACTWLTSNCVTVSELLITLDSPTVRRLIIERGNQDAAVDEFWNQKHSDEEELQHIRDEKEHPEKYTAGRSEFLRAIIDEPSLTLPKGTYLLDIGTSKAKCFLDGTPTFRKIRVNGGRLNGKEGWTCRPTRPVVEVP